VRPEKARAVDRIADLVEPFCLSLRVFGRSPATLRAYTTDLHCFVSFLRETSHPDTVQAVDRRVIRRYLEKMTLQDLAPSTRDRRFRSLSSFLRWAVDEEYIETSPARAVHLRRPKQKLPEPLTASEWHQLLRAIEHHGGHKPGSDRRRDLCIVLLLGEAGLRRTEAASLRWSDIDFGTGYLRVTGKGGEERAIPLSPALSAALWEYLHARLPVRDRHERVIPLSPARLSDWVARYCRWAGIPGRVSAHALRHTFATRLLAQGANLRQIQEALGHLEVSTTMRYARVMPGDLARIISAL
jgi:integrase/recombinase XerC